MRLPGSRQLAWLLRLATDISLVVWLGLLTWTLVLMVQYGGSPGGARQGSIYSELKLPPELVQASDPDVSVFNLEASQFRVHFRTAKVRSAWARVRAVVAVAAWWGVFALVLWQVRQILATFVRRAPLTLENAGRFRLISYLLVLDLAMTSLWRTLEYLRLAPIFPVLPPRGFFDLFFGHIEWSRLFAALLILLLAEAVRLGAEHRVDSEAVI